MCYPALICIDGLSHRSRMVTKQWGWPVNTLVSRFDCRVRLTSSNINHAHSILSISRSFSLQPSSVPTSASYSTTVLPYSRPSASYFHPQTFYSPTHASYLSTFSLPAVSTRIIIKQRGWAFYGTTSEVKHLTCKWITRPKPRLSYDIKGSVYSLSNISFLSSLKHIVCKRYVLTLICSCLFPLILTDLLI